MTLQDLDKKLKIITNNVAYSHFNNPVQLPFICYLESDTDNFMADNKVYYKVQKVDIELYTKKKDIRIEAALEKLFFNENIPWNKDESWLDDQQCYEVIYTISL